MNTGNYSDLNYFSVINNPTSFFTVGFASVFKALVSVIKLDISELSNNKLIIYFFQLLLIYILFKLVTQLVVITNTFIEKILGQKTSVFDNSKGLQGGMTKSAQIMSNSRKQFQKLGKTARNAAINTKPIQAIANSKIATTAIKGINAIFYNYELCKNNEGKSMFCGNNDKIRNKLKRSRLVNYIYEINDELSAMRILNLR